jgi:hypothetical protein
VLQHKIDIRRCVLLSKERKISLFKKYGIVCIIFRIQTIAKFASVPIRLELLFDVIQEFLFNRFRVSS